MQYNLSQGSLDGYSRAFHCEGNIISLQVNSVSNPTMTYKLQGALNGTWLDIDDDFGYIFGQANDMPHLYDTTRYDSLRVWLESWTDANIYIKYIIGSCACSSDVVQLDLRLDHAEEEIENVSDALDQVIKDLDGYYYFEIIVGQGSQIQDLRDAADGYIRADGTKELTADWDAGSFSIHADNLDGKNEGVLYEPTITDLGGLTLKITSTEVLARDSANWIGNLNRYTVPETTTLAVTDNALNYIVVDNASTPGSPVYAALLSNATINNSTILPVARVYIDSGTLEYTLFYGTVGRSAAIRNFDRVMRVRGTGGIERESGFAVTETATRVVNIASGVAWFGVDRVSLDAIAQGGAGVTSELWYHSGGNWTKTAITQYNNTQYDNGTDLVTLTANRYAANWIFRNIVSSEIDIVLGTGDYTLAQAEAAMVPSLPGAISGFYVLVGKIIVQKSASTATLIQSVINTAFTSSAITDHGSLSGLSDNDHPQYAFPLNSADGYVCFFADGNNYIAGDNDLYWNRELNRLQLGTDTKLTLGNTGYYITGDGDSIDFYTNGIMAQSMSANTVYYNKPLNMQSGNKIYSYDSALSIGTHAASSHSLGTGDAIVGGKFEVDGETWIDGTFNAYSSAVFWGSVSLKSDISIGSSAGNNGIRFYGANQTPDSILFLVGPESNSVVFAEWGDRSVDFAFPLQTNPTICIQSANSSTPLNRFYLQHDQTNAQIKTDAGGITLDPASGAIEVDGYIYDNGSALRLGSNASTANGLTTGDVLVGGKLETTDTAYLTSASGYGAVVQSDTTSPSKAALRFIPQDTDPASPLEGDVYYNSTSHKLKVYNGSTWVDLH